MFCQARPIWSTNPFSAPQLSIAIGIRLISHSSCQCWRKKKRARVIYLLYSGWRVGRSHGGAWPFRQPQHTIGHFLCSVRLRKWSDLSSPIVPGPLRGAWPARQVPKWAREPRARWNWIWFDGQFYSIRHTSTAITENLQVWNYCKIVELWSKKKDGVGQKVMRPGGDLHFEISHN